MTTSDARSRPVSQSACTASAAMAHAARSRSDMGVSLDTFQTASARESCAVAAVLDAGAAASISASMSASVCPDEAPLFCPMPKSARGAHAEPRERQGARAPPAERRASAARRGARQAPHAPREAHHIARTPVRPRTTTGVVVLGSETTRRNGLVQQQRSHRDATLVRNVRPTARETAILTSRNPQACQTASSPRARLASLCLRNVYEMSHLIPPSTPPRD